VNRYTAHIINHTHWDREWFLTSIYTSQWIPGLVDRLQILVDENPDFHFLLDGQTLIIEDLLSIRPEYKAAVNRLVTSGSLQIGPYYCQPDWRLTSGEALLRNILHGLQDLAQFKGSTRTGWLVDTFGHISQAPQLHRLFGIEAVYIWRGAPKMDPYFTWRGSDGSRLFTINLFGGYRNLYGVTHAQEIAWERLEAELRKLGPFYPTPDIPMFDGYDLEDNPEDPVRFFQTNAPKQSKEIKIKEATPESFAKEMRVTLEDLPVITGELGSGKFGAVFPGTLSTRTYLKVMSRDCEHLLYMLCEPLGAMAALRGRDYLTKDYDNWSRALLQNAVHDCICGVSIDQVHEKMEFLYRQTFEAMQVDLRRSLAYILADFSPGIYAVSTNPFPYEGWFIDKGSLFRIKTGGVGVWEAGERLPVKSSARVVESFSWKNNHFEARVDRDGSVRVEDALLGSMIVSEEKGDAYSGETGEFLGKLIPSGSLLLEQESDIHARLSLPLAAEFGEIQVSAVLHLIFDDSPLIQWEIDLDSRGTDFRVDIEFETAQPGKIFAGMPFDVVNRMAVEEDLLPRQLEKNLGEVLLGQRELGMTRTFPFHDYVAVSDGSRTAAVLAKGVHAYEAEENGRISIILRRSIQWLTKSNLQHRIGDAGPFFYVPDARCERVIKHELAVMFLKSTVEEPAFQALNAGFQNPSIVAEARGAGRRRSWRLFNEYLPLSSMRIDKGRLLVRLSNPSSVPHLLSDSYLVTAISGKPQPKQQVVDPKKIVTLALDETSLPETAFGDPVGEKEVEIIHAPTWRVGQNQSRPEAGVIDSLKGHAGLLERNLEDIEDKLSKADGEELYSRQHELYVLQRELLETRLTVRLNEIKMSRVSEPDREYLYSQDEETAEIGRELNQLRIKRRIYDYIIQLVGSDLLDA
jgi:alpha-mannosidase